MAGLSANPASADAFQKASAALGRRDLPRALALFRQGLVNDPHNAQALCMAAACAHGLGDLPVARSLIAKAHEARPQDQEILSLFGLILADGGERTASRRVYEELVALNPRHAGAQAGLGSLLAADQRFEEAVEHLERSRSVLPESLEIAFQLANALRLAGRMEQAVAGYQALLERAPGLVPVQINLGGLLLSLGRAGEAVAVLEQAARSAPTHGLIWGNLAAAFLLIGDLANTVSAAEKSIGLDPKNPQAQVVLGNALSNLKRPGDAMRCFETALSLDPSNREAMIALANQADAADDFEAAIEYFRRALARSPNDPCTLGSLYLLLRRTCRWAEADALEEELDRLAFVAGNTPAEPVMTSVTRSGDPQRNLQVAQAWSRMIEGKMGYDHERPRPVVGPRDRLRIGYLSYDFRDHAVGHLIRSLFGQHDRAGFEILAFSYGPDDGSAYRRHFEQSCDRFVDLAHRSHGEAAAAIRDEEIDILVDLAGHTKGNRLEICALRPAPLQVTWLGFPGTTGAEFMDYILTDAVLTPAVEASNYSEALVLLPNSYQANDRWQEIAEDAGERAEHGLPEQGFVFASMVNSYKIDATVFECWMRLLKAVPGSLLWLLCRLETVKDRLRAEAEKHGIEPDRLIFAPFLAKADHLARLAHADLALDTRVYTGHTTTSDCLFAGLPVVTSRGSHFASRVSESLLCAIGLPQLVTEDLAAYESLALSLARDPATLARLRGALADNRLTTPLFDTAQMALDLERAYRAMWERAQAGLPPRLIRVAGEIQPEDTGS